MSVERPTASIAPVSASMVSALRKRIGNTPATVASVSGEGIDRVAIENEGGFSCAIKIAERDNQVAVNCFCAATEMS